MTTTPGSATPEADGLLDGERQTLERIATGAPLEAVLDALCRLIDHQCGLMSLVMLVDDEGRRLTLVAGPHLPDEWRRATSSIPLSPTSTACGAAAIRREQVIVPDVLADPVFESLREVTRSTSIRAAWSTPFFSRDRHVLGTFAVLSPVPGTPDERNLQLVERATHLASIAVERHQSDEVLQRSERLLRLVLDALPVGVAVMGLSGDIILSNPASKHIWAGTIGSGRERYAESKGWWHGSGERIAPEEWASVRAVIRGESSVNEVIEIEAFDGVRKIIQNSAVPIRDADERITGAVVVNEDITARKRAESALTDSYSQMRTLTARLMRAQDDERRRIAQMLHETTAQDLAALKMLLARLNRSPATLGDADRSALTESIALAEQAMKEIRTVSYLLHPPFLDEMGLLSALRWYAAGFAERSGIPVELDLPESFERLPLDTETALFRIVQESLINIHRHSGSDSARIRLRREQEELVLEIEDRGHGMSKDILARIIGGGGVGVGIAGTSERIEQLGGRLEIESKDTGTTVRARLPIAKEAG